MCIYIYIYITNTRTHARTHAHTHTHTGDNTFSLAELSKKIVKLDKHIYAGFTILDLSKLHMYDFHNTIMMPKYGDNIQLLTLATH